MENTSREKRMKKVITIARWKIF